MNTHEASHRYSHEHIHSNNDMYTARADARTRNNTHTCTHTCTRTCTCITHTHMHMHMHTPMYTHMYTYHAHASQHAARTLTAFSVPTANIGGSNGEEFHDRQLAPVESETWEHVQCHVCICMCVHVHVHTFTHGVTQHGRHKCVAHNIATQQHAHACTRIHPHNRDTSCMICP